MSLPAKTHATTRGIKRSRIISQYLPVILKRISIVKIIYLYSGCNVLISLFSVLSILMTFRILMRVFGRIYSFINVLYINFSHGFRPSSREDQGNKGIYK